MIALNGAAASIGSATNGTKFQAPRYAVVTNKTIQPGRSDDDRIVAVGLLTRRDLALLGARFDRAFPVDSDNDDFSHLLKAIDAADRRYRKAPQ